MAAGNAVAKPFFYPQLNGLRFVFVFMVMVHHWGPQTFFEQYRIGWVGVDLFYVLSGFLIGEILLREKQTTSKSPWLSIRNFAVRRVLRIFPLYYAVVILYSLFVRGSNLLPYNLTYTNNIIQAFWPDVIPEDFWHLWSLCVEEQFYLVFPFLIFFVPTKFYLRMLIGGILFSVLGRIVLGFATDHWNLYLLMPFCLDSLFMGVLLAYLKTHRPELLLRLFGSQNRVFFFVALATAALICLCFANRNWLLFGFLRTMGSVAGFLLIGYSVMRGYSGLIQKFLENRFIALLGAISYGLYLLHSFIERIYYDHFADNSLRNWLFQLRLPVISNLHVIDFVVLFSASVVVAYLSFRFFENRFLKLKAIFT